METETDPERDNIDADIVQCAELAEGENTLNFAFTDHPEFVNLLSLQSFDELVSPMSHGSSPRPTPSVEPFEPSCQNRPNAASVSQQRQFLAVMSSHATSAIAAAPTRQSNGRAKLTESDEIEIASWMPITLRLSYLGSLFVLTVVLGVVVIGLTAYSRAHSGLCEDNGSATLFFSWRFLPTLIAVIYVVLVETMVQDIRRTEVFARLSRRNPASASNSVCWPVRSWWNDPVDAISKEKNNGHRSWALFFASLINIVGFLIISPLSAALLSPEFVKTSTESNFLQADLSLKLDRQYDDLDMIMFRSISGSLLHTTTSPWITDDYFVSPVWPRAINTPSFEASLLSLSSAQKWSASATVFQTTFECTPLTFAGMSNTTALAVGGPGLLYNNENLPVLGLHLAAGQDCLINVYDVDTNTSIPSNPANGLNTPSRSNYIFKGGGSWSQTIGKFSAIDWRTDWDAALVNYTGACPSGSFWLVNQPYQINDPLSLQGGLCSTTYYMANIPVTVIATNYATNVTFDAGEFKRSRTPIPLHVLNTTELGKSFFTYYWAEKVQDPYNYYTMPYFFGPMQAIAASPEYEYSLTRMMDVDRLQEKMRAFQQRWLGQTILASIKANNAAATNSSLAGSIETSQNRIAVVFGVGLALALLLLLLALCMLITAHYTRPSVRHLGVNEDPIRIDVMASLIAKDLRTQLTFDGLGTASARAIDASFRYSEFILRDGTVNVADRTQIQPMVSFSDTPSPHPRRQPSLSDADGPEKDIASTAHAKPLFLRLWMGFLLLILTVALIIALFMLYKISLSHGLFDRALVYELDLHIGEAISRLAPYSILPTLIAVGFKLWYNAVAETISRQQPFRSMLNRPALLTSSIATDYGNIPMALTMFRACKNNHWLLALAGLGVLGGEVLTVGMSALWTKELITKISSLNIAQQLEIRAVPLMYSVPDLQMIFGYNPTKAFVKETVYGTFLTSWLYEAVLELTEQSKTPPWSRDQLAFVPIDLAPTQNAASAIVVGNSSKAQAYNITAHTSAIRARLDCRPLEFLSNRSSWLTAYNFSNSIINPINNISVWEGYQIPEDLATAYEIKSVVTFYDQKNQYGINKVLPLGSAAYVFDCCSNVTTDGPGLATIGYWGPGKDEAISVKWFVGKPLDPIYFNPSIAQKPGSFKTVKLLWPEAPQLQAIDCQPHIETANATVTLDAMTGTVYNYSINSNFSNSTDAWLDQYVVRVPSRINSSQIYDHFNDTSVAFQTITASFGQIFLDALLGASDFVTYTREPNIAIHDQGNHSFAFRTRGSNTDFMSYAMLQLVNNDMFALLNVDQLIEKANYVFATFFKHYAAENVSVATGGSVFQPIGAQLPQSISDAINSTTQGYVNSNAVDLPGTTEVLIHIAVDALVMSPVAVFMCLTILFFLIITIVVIFWAYNSRGKTLPRDVDTLASVLGFVHASEDLLDWASKRAERHDWNSKDVGKGLLAYMGPFRDRTGVSRWGIELMQKEESTGEITAYTPSARPLLPDFVHTV